MKTMNHSIKTIVALLFCIILVLPMTLPLTASAEKNESNVIYSTVSISLRHNFMLSKYGVTVYFDNVKAAHLNQGDMTTFGAYMEPNQAHELRFVADKYEVPDRVWTISNLQHGSVITCELQSKHDQVKIRQCDLYVDGAPLFEITPEIEKQVMMLGTIIVAGISVQ